jgi:5-methylcytosine-specific restriction endonuclease McrA
METVDPQASLAEVSRLVFTRDGWQCRHCKDRNGLHAHHVIYRSEGGSDTMDNLITLCAQCHRAHHDGDLHISVLSVTPNSPVVSFVRVNGWRPT